MTAVWGSLFGEISDLRRKPLKKWIIIAVIAVVAYKVLQG